MKILVPIVTRNRKDRLEFVINKFLEQTYENKEIVVLDNASTDGTGEMMKEKFPDIRYYYFPNNIDFFSLNFAAFEIESDVIWRTDDDSHPERVDSFEFVVDVLKKYKDVAVVAFNYKDEMFDFRPIEWFRTRVEKKREENLLECFQFTGPGAALRTSMFKEVGGLKSYGWEELDYSIKILSRDFSILCNPEFSYLHYGSASRMSPQVYIKRVSELCSMQIRHFGILRGGVRAIQIFFFEFLFGIYRLYNPLVFIELTIVALLASIHAIRSKNILVLNEKIRWLLYETNPLYSAYEQIITKFKSRRQE